MDGGRHHLVIVLRRRLASDVSPVVGCYRLFPITVQILKRNWEPQLDPYQSPVIS